MERLLRRRDFLAAANSLSWGTPSFLMQVRKRDDDGAYRVGFTCTKRLGNAVVRNRIRRRLKEAARLTMPGLARPAHDYVLIGRQGAITRDFEAIRKDIISALDKIHGSDNRTRPS